LTKKKPLENKIPETNGKACEKPTAVQMYNFIVFVQRKSKPQQKRILQVDFETKVLALIDHGNFVKTEKFSSIMTVEGQNSKHLSIHFEDSLDFDIAMETLSDKIKLIRLLHVIMEQNEYEEKGLPFNQYERLQQSFTVIKAGVLEREEAFGTITWIKFVIFKIMTLS